MGKKFSILPLLIVLVMMMICSISKASIRFFSGFVSSSETFEISAECSERIGNIYISVGQLVSRHTLIADMNTGKVYSPANGKISGIFGYAGDSIKSVTERYGSVLYIEPQNKYMLKCSTEKSYPQAENKYIHIGETVFLSCTQDGSHEGTGVVTSVDEDNPREFTVEVIDGEFYMNETVGIFRNSSYASMTRIGRGTIDRSKSIAIDAEGSVLKIHVQNGEYVKRGQLLFETVADEINFQTPPNSQIFCGVDGIVASVDVAKGDRVEKGDTIATVYPLNNLQVHIIISETDLMEVFLGKKVFIEFNWDQEHQRKFEGVVSSISYISQNQSSSLCAEYLACIDFEADINTRVGMTALVYLQ